MRIEADGPRISIWCPALEVHDFTSAEAADKRARFVREALTWVGTPFRDCADVKGRTGGVDCAMMMVRSAVDSGLMAPFDPRPYAPRWHMHRNEEKFLDWLQQRLGAYEVAEPRVGDVIVYRFGRTFSHGSIVVNANEVVHAYSSAGLCLLSRRDEPLLNWAPLRSQNHVRASKAFGVWGG